MLEAATQTNPTERKTMRRPAQEQVSNLQQEIGSTEMAVKIAANGLCKELNKNDIDSILVMQRIESMKTAIACLEGYTEQWIAHQKSEVGR